LKKGEQPPSLLNFGDGVLKTTTKKKRKKRKEVISSPFAEGLVMALEKQ
jgi:hypothetical protein